MKGQPKPNKRRRDLNKLSDALHVAQSQAKARGLDKLTLREINAEIAAYRREQDPLYGQTKSVRVVLSLRMYRELKAAAKALSGTSVLSFVVRQAIGDYLRNQVPNLKKQPSRR
jgi:hypothetical protein